MIRIEKLGENTMHDSTFFVDRPQGHPVYLLLLVKSTAKFFIQNKWERTHSDIAVIFQPYQKHLYCADENKKDFPSYINHWAHLTCSVCVLPEHFPYGLPIQLHNPTDYYDLFHLIHNEFYGVNPHKNTIIDSLTTALLHKISDESNTEKFPDLYYELVRLRERIYSFPSENWNIDAMADMLHISKGYLHSTYRYFFNTTCIKDVICSRIQASCDLLLSTTKSVDEIAHLCGYHCTEHFIRQFKGEMKMTPSKYRKLS